jgi:excisionase family DNA binding protein
MKDEFAEQSEWVSLGEAANILGVHPTTVRHWADSGALPSRRTPGGHRRFQRDVLIQWTSRQEPQQDSPTEAQLMLQSALGRARIEVVDGQLHGLPWYDKLNRDAREAHSRLGRRLLAVLTRYLSDPGEYENLHDDVRDMGIEYAQISHDQQLSLTETVQAFLFFRDLLVDSVIQMAGSLSLHTPADWGSRLRQTNHITDEMLLALIEAYQSNSGED